VRLVRGVLRAIGLGLSVGLAVLVGGLALVLVVVPKATGSTPLTVLTQSMEPRLPPGTLLVVRPTPVRDIRVGDVLTYQIASGQAAVISHRVVAITSSSTGARTFVTKGDANAEADPDPVTVPQIRGTLWYSVPDAGYVDQIVNGDRGWLVPSIAVALLVYSAVMIALGLRSAVRRRRGERAARAALTARPFECPNSGTGTRDTRA
jgi:signal peptidase I